VNFSFREDWSNKGNCFEAYNESDSRTALNCVETQSRAPSHGRITLATVTVVANHLYRPIGRSLASRIVMPVGLLCRKGFVKRGRGVKFRRRRASARYSDPDIDPAVAGRYGAANPLDRAARSSAMPAGFPPARHRHIAPAASGMSRRAGTRPHRAFPLFDGG